jgi:Na+-transporting NADH:ubiquinone oxidoreductase subunit NqrC
MSNTASTIKLEEVKAAPSTETPVAQAAPEIPAEQVKAEPVAPAAAAHTVYVAPVEQKTQDRYSRGIIVGILFSCLVAIIPATVAFNLSTKQAEALSLSKSQILDLKSGIAYSELKNLETRLAEIEAAEQQLLALINEKPQVMEGIDNKKLEIERINAEASSLRASQPSITEMAKQEFDATVSGR